MDPPDGAQGAADPPYRSFKDRWFDFIRNVVQDEPPFAESERLCRVVYGSNDAETLCNERSVRVAILEAYHGPHVEPPAARVARLLWPNELFRTDRGSVSFERTLEVSRPSLLELPLVTRVIAVLYFFGWDRCRGGPIGRVIQDALAPLTDKLNPPLPPPRAHRVLQRFRKNLWKAVREGVDQGEYLREMIFHEDDISLEGPTVVELRRFAESPTRRSGGRTDKYARIRDRWERAREYLTKHLSLEQLLQPKEPGNVPQDEA